MNTIPRPHLLFLCHPLTGHFTPVLRLACLLHARSWSVSFLSSTLFRTRVEAAGLLFFPLLDDADLDDATLFPQHPHPSPEEGPDDPLHGIPSIIDSNHQALLTIPSQWASVKAALAALAGAQVVVLCEAFFYGGLPLRLGASLPPAIPRPPSLCISITAPAILSADLPPFGSTLPFDTTPEGKARSAAARADWAVTAAPVTALLHAKLVEAGAQRRLVGEGGAFMQGVNYTAHDAILQVGVEAFEYRRSDFPPGFKFIGLPLAPQPPMPTHLPWWAELEANTALPPHSPQKRHVVVVAQGTVETDPTELILPTLQGLAARADILCIAILGSRGAALPSTAVVPPNARIADYLHYDVVLPHAAVWVHNGGYGAVSHGIRHGVPMVVAGAGQDKPESCGRVAWSGLGVDLRGARPGMEALVQGVGRVLEDPRFKRVALRMQAAALRMDCAGLVEEEIFRLAEVGGGRI